MVKPKILDTFSTIKASIFLLIKNPKLFLPKLIVAVLYGVGILLSVNLVNRAVGFTQIPREQLVFDELQSFLVSALLLFVLTVLTYFVDLFFSGLYPFLVEQSKNGKVSFFKAFVQTKPKLYALFVSGILVWLLLMLVSFIEAGIILFFNLSWEGAVISFVITFAFIFLFYFLFPIIVFKKENLGEIFKKTFISSFSNKKTVFIYSLISFSVSIIKYSVAFYSSSPQMLVLFWGLVLLTAIVYSIHAVVNQLLYVSVSKKGK